MVDPEKRLHEIQKYLRTIFAKQESFLVKKKKEKNIFAPPFYIALKKCWTFCFLSIAEKMNASFTVFTVKARDICMHWKCKSGRIYRKKHYWKILL